MASHLSEEQIAHYKGRRLAPEELLSVDDHISQCADCRHRIASPADLQTALQNKLAVGTAYLRTKTEHLSYEQMEAYVDGKISKADQASLRVHLEFCKTCSEELRDLNTFKAELTPSNELGGQAFWARFAARWFRVPRVAFALSACGIVALAISVGIWRKGSPNHGPSPQTANIHPAGNGQFAKPSLTGINELAPDEQAAIAEAISNERIKFPEALQELKHAGPEVLLGQAEETLQFKLFTPISEVVANDRPLFRWQPLAGGSSLHAAPPRRAISYSVAIFDLELNEVQSSPALHATQWTPDRPLKRGQAYLWQVTARLSEGKSVTAPSPPNPEARFQILDQKRADEIARFRAAHPQSHIALGILEAQAGLLESAETELQQVPESATDYALAQKLLKSIQEIQHARP